MKFDVVITGGGLSGLVAGTALAKARRKVAIISSGQSALHFCSGSFGLLGKAGGKTLESPLAGIELLPPTHPYRKMGAEATGAYADAAPLLFAEAGITLKGTSRANHRHLSPLGKLRSSWLTMGDFMTFSGERPPMKDCVIVNFEGFLDFYPSYLADGLGALGVRCRTASVKIEAVERLRRSSGEMRAASVARLLRGEALEELAIEINKVCGDADTVFIPAVIGFDSEEHLQRLRRMVGVPLYCVPVTPMSVTGHRAQQLLRHRFGQLGGTYLLGDSAVAAHMNADGSVRAIETASLCDDYLEADRFILAGGGIFSRGIVAAPHKIYEPLFGLDVQATDDRDRWFDADFFARQPYMSFGVATDAAFHPLRGGSAVENLYAAGAVLGGADPLTEESGAGIAITTALHVADLIINS